MPDARKLDTGFFEALFETWEELRVEPEEFIETGAESGVVAERLVGLL